MREESRFKTERFMQHAERTYGRMELTTLRRTGLEPVLERATKKNLDALKGVMTADEFGSFKEFCTPESAWNMVRSRGLASKGKQIVVMSLGDPSKYPDFAPNPDVIQALGKISFDQEAVVRMSAGYTHSFGFIPLLEKLKRANFFNPASVGNDPAKYKDVKVYVTAGGSYAAGLAMGPVILTPNDSVVVHDWTYISHTGAAYERGAHLLSYECREDGRPDTSSLEDALSSEKTGKDIQAVVFTPIGNPIGAAMTREDIVDHLKAIADASKREGRPILAMIDVAYEAFRRDGMPLDPIAIAIEEGIEAPVAVMDTASKGYGTCGWRIGALKIYWPEGLFPDYRADYFKALENKLLPTLGVVAVPLQMAFNSFFDSLEKDPETMKRTVEFFRRRRELVNANLVALAEAIKGIGDSVYLARYYDHGGHNGGIEPETLSSFYLMLGFTRLAKDYGSGFNQAVAFGEFAMERADLPLVSCVPGQSFLPEKRWAKHPALIRVTGLTPKEDTEAFLRAVEAYAKHLG
jgi:aspartate/methionine/tyrosine aminotransferase